MLGLASKNDITLIQQCLEKVVAEVGERLAGLDERLNQAERRRQAALENLLEDQRSGLEILGRLAGPSPAVLDFAAALALERLARESSNQTILDRKFQGLLDHFELELVAEAGVAFDLARHEACDVRFDPGQPESVALEVIEPGFIQRGEVLRYASVVVNRPPREAEAARRMIHCLLEGGTPPEALSLAGNRLKASEDDLLRALDGDLSPSHKFIIRETLEHIQEIEARIKRFDEQLFHGLTPYNWALDILRTVPGLDMIGTAMLLVEIGVDMEVFGDASCLASWAGLCPGNNESAGKRKNGRSRKGNRHVRRQMCETANAARKTTSQFKGKYQSLVGRQGHKRGIIAIAHKLLRIVFALLKNKQAYKDDTVNYEEMMVKRNAPRWIIFLKKYSMMPQSAK